MCMRLTEDEFVELSRGQIMKAEVYCVRMFELEESLENLI